MTLAKCCLNFLSCVLDTQIPTFLSLQRPLYATVWGYLNFGDKNGLLGAFTASERKPRNQQKNLGSEFVQLLQQIPTAASRTLQKHAYAFSALLGLG